MLATCPEMAVIVGERIRQARKARHIKQDSLAAEVGYGSRAAIAQIENGLTLPSLEKAVAIARTLHVRIGWMLGEEGEITEKVVPGWVKERLAATQKQLANISHEIDTLVSA